MLALVGEIAAAFDPDTLRSLLIVLPSLSRTVILMSIHGGAELLRARGFPRAECAIDFLVDLPGFAGEFIKFMGYGDKGARCVASFIAGLVWIGFFAGEDSFGIHSSNLS